MKIGVITLFPDSFNFLNSKKSAGLVGKAFENGSAELFIEDLRESGIGRHQVVDSSPYGGGDGMVLKAEPIRAALESILKKMCLSRSEVKTVYTCPSGDLWTQKKAESWVSGINEGETKPSKQNIIILCGRYAGADVRVVEALFDEKISLGPFILNGGELPALCLIETMVRLLPGVLGNPDSIQVDSFSAGMLGIEADPFTKPQVWEGRAVPEVLLSGDHKKIEKYRAECSKTKTSEWLEKANQALKACLDLN